MHRITYGIGLCFLIGIIAFIAMILRDVEQELYADITADLLRLEQLHTEQYQNVLLVESGMRYDYEAIEEIADEISLLSKNVIGPKTDDIAKNRTYLEHISFLIDMGLYEDIEDNIDDELIKYEYLWREQEKQIGRYQKHRSVLNHSFRELMELMQALAEAEQKGQLSKELMLKVTIFYDEMLMYSVNHDPEIFDVAEGHLLDMKKTAKIGNEPKEVHALFEEFLEHADTTVQYVLRNHRLINSIIYDGGITTLVVELRHLYITHRELLRKDMRMIRLIAFILAVMLIIYVGALIVAALNRSRYLAQSSNKMKAEFLASMSHEVRTPMNGILGMMELILGDDLNIHQRKRAEAVMNSAESLMVILDDILDFSKIESGQLEIHPTTFNMHEQMHEVSELFSYKLMQKKVSLWVNMSASVPYEVIGDPIRIRQIVSNFLSNAVKFTEYGHIIVNVRRVIKEEGEMLYLSVEDTGIGIDSDKQARIFDKFTQADGSTTREFGGTGLGLAICTQLAEMMGGEVGLRSEKGKGSEFWCMIPLDLPEKSELPPTAMFGDVKGKAILLVDNRPAVYHALERYCEEHEVKVELCSSLEQVPKLLSVRMFDAIVIASQMHMMTPGLVYEQLQSLCDLRDSKVAIVVSREEKNRLDRRLEATEYQYIASPIACMDILQLVSDKRDDYAMAASYVSSEPALQKSVSPVDNLDALLRKDGDEIRVLLVEDNQVNQLVAVQMLEDLGCKVHVAVNGSVALEDIRTAEFDLVFMDCQMPVMDGYEATGRLRDMMKKGYISHIPIIALTANAMKQDKEKCLAAGMHDYLSKPVKKDALQQMLAKWVLGDIAQQDVTAIAGNRMVEPNQAADSEPSDEDEAIVGEGKDIAVDEINMDEVEGAKAMLGERFEAILDGYYEDAAYYVQCIEQGVREDNMQLVAENAHPLKSSSASLGLTSISEIAKYMEVNAKAGCEVDDIKAMLGPLNAAIEFSVSELKT